MRRFTGWICFVLSTSAALSTVYAADISATPAAAAVRNRPTMADFMGLNVHTVGFKPDLYAPICRRLRDYHPMIWDTGDETDHVTTFPMAINGVSWKELYGTWTQKGYDVDSCVQIDSIAADKWKDPQRDAKAYGEAFARFFGPSGEHKWVTSIEIGNEPAQYSSELYRTLFEAMAKGIRTGDPKLKVVTCAVMTGKPDQWSKPMSAVAGLESLYDVINIHSYAFKDAWPTWRRSYPEDPSIKHLKEIEGVIQWRNEHAKGKEVWLTEFGYDSSTHQPDPGGPWAKWVGVTDEQQAQYIVRSFLVFSAMDVDRAYLYFFNDKDEAQLHAASGLTRDYKPKPAFHAVSHLYKTLGDYRFIREIIKKEGELYCYEYAEPAPSTERVFVAWSPTADAKAGSKTLPLGKAAAAVYRAEAMPLSAGTLLELRWKLTGDSLEINVGSTPVYLWAK